MSEMIGGEKMIPLSFTRFINFTSLDPHKRAQYVKKLKYDDDYHFGKDYYGPVRNGIVSFHKRNRDSSYLDEIVIKAKESRKPNYLFVIDQYKDFLDKNKNLEWYTPPEKQFVYNDLLININPELGLKIKGKPTLVKLFFTDDGVEKKLTSGKAQLIFRLMKIALDESIEDDKYAIMNMKTGKLINQSKKENEFIDLNLETHLESFLHIWRNI
ncbi:hypothetical protein ABE137_01005 [Brevibacillus laterosporus]|uniref:hypothetical protein n=1 Tax=Brevibacillus laterosporus TaxID=1465 RepID=UPI003D200BC6